MKKLKKVSNILLLVSCVAVIGYTITAIIVQIATGVELSPTLTTAWFGFWGVEIIALATIKNCKTTHGKDVEDITDEETFD